MSVPVQFRKSAPTVIKKFRARELAGLMGHLRLHGPLQNAPSHVTARHGDKMREEPASVVLPNPFIPLKNPQSGKWRPPKYSLRRQADLVKKAQAARLLETMPQGPKTFAMELRMKRLQAAFPEEPKKVSVSSDSAGVVVPTKDPAPVPSQTRWVKGAPKMKEAISTLKNKRHILKEQLASLEPQHDVDQLTNFEQRSDETVADHSDRLSREENYFEIIGRIEAVEKQLADAEHALTAAKAIEDTAEKKRAVARLWQNPVWVGEVKPKATKGEELGARLYAGKKKMFKGHLWERQKSKRVRRQSILMRDMAARVARYKSYYKKRKPNPLKPSRLTKPPKLPF